MSEGEKERVSVQLTTTEAKLVIAALKQFEPYWPAGMDDLNRANLLEGIRGAIDHVVASMGASA